MFITLKKWLKCSSGRLLIALVGIDCLRQAFLNINIHLLLWWVQFSIFCRLFCCPKHIDPQQKDNWSSEVIHLEACKSCNICDLFDNAEGKWLLFGRWLTQNIIIQWNSIQWERIDVGCNEECRAMSWIND